MCKEKEDEEAHQLFLSHFSKNWKGTVCKDKKMVNGVNEDEQR